MKMDILKMTEFRKPILQSSIDNDTNGIFTFNVKYREQDYYLLLLFTYGLTFGTLDIL